MCQQSQLQLISQFPMSKMRCSHVDHDGQKAHGLICYDQNDIIQHIAILYIYNYNMIIDFYL